MSYVLFLLLRQESRFHFRTPLHYFFQAFASLLSLTVYWYTSKALTGVTQSQLWGTSSYFEFLVIAEIALMVPSIICTSVFRAIRFTAFEGMIEEFLLLPRSPFASFSALAGSMLWRDLIQAIFTVVFAIFIFDFHYPVQAWAGFFLILVLSIPLFWGIAWIGGAAYFIYGRGEGVMNQLLNVLTVFAGAYFPLHILPDEWRRSLEFSPLTFFLNHVRKIFAGDFSQIPEAAVVLLVGGAVTVFIGYVFAKFALRRLKRAGIPNFSHS